MKNNLLKGKMNGITLIALVITIIVLLILAGISISMLSGDNSILKRASDAKTNTNTVQIQERINIAYQSSFVDGQGKVTETSLENALKKEFNKTSLDEGWLDKTSEVGKWIITIDEVSQEVPAGNSSSSSSIDYGNKNEQTIAVGDDISIGTEKFKVIKKSSDGKTITAMPYYNLKLNETPIKQVTEATAGEQNSVGNAGTVAFSSISSPTWDVINGIDLDLHQNNIKEYIEGYATTLNNMGARNVYVKLPVAKGQEYPDSIENVQSDLLNPSKVGWYWCGTSGAYMDDPTAMYVEKYVMESHRLFYAHYADTEYGVRPIIIIDLEGNGDFLQRASETKVAEINSKIGTVVNGYSAQNLQWQVFYADQDETFLISKTIAEENYRLQAESANCKAMNELKYGSKWNSIWLQSSPNTTYRCYYDTSFLCDPDNWNKYKTGIANYAVGGPTLELFIKSWNKSQGTTYTLTSSAVAYNGRQGYTYNFSFSPTGANNGVYSDGNNTYFLASPGYGESHAAGCQMKIVTPGGVTIDYWDWNRYDGTEIGLRPVVSIPTSKISVSGNTLTII